MRIYHTLKFILGHPLTRDRKLRTLIGYTKWQIGSRLIPGQVVYKWIDGARFIVRPNETGLTGNVYCGLHEFSDMAYVLHSTCSDDLFVDIGTNVGSYTILACAVNGARGYCFEPVPTTYRRLLDNIRLNDLSDRVKAFNLGLSDKEEELAFTSGKGPANHVLAKDEKSTDVVNVAVMPLDVLLQDQSPSLIKIDAEGFEAQVLRGAHSTLSNPSLHSVIMELNGSGDRYGFSEDKILEVMRDYGFLTFDYEPFTRELKPTEGKRSSGNTLFIRHEKAVKQKLKASPRVQIGHVRL